MPVRGGEKLKAALRKGQRAQGVKGVRVGLFASAVYPKIGTGREGKKRGYRKGRRRIPVTNVAAWIEFGTRRAGKLLMKARPVMRFGNLKIERRSQGFLAPRVDPQTMVVDRLTAEHFGLWAVRIYQETVHSFDPPPFDTGFYKRSFTHKVIE